MPDLDQFIKNIIYIRKKNRLNQDDFSKMLGVKRSVVGAYEQRKANPSIETLMNISEQFGIDVETLLYKDLREPAIPDQLDIINKLNHLQEEINQLKNK